MTGQTQESIRVAAISDIHMGHEDRRYPQERELEHALRAMDGVQDMLFVVGDITNRGSSEGLSIFAELAKGNFHGQIIAVGGNHDSSEGMKILQKAGIVVLEGRTHIVEKNGLRIGIYGQNGSLPRDIREPLRGLGWDEQALAHHEYTRTEYHPRAQEQISSLVESGVDVLVVLSHVPLFPQQVSDYEDNKLYEMAPDTAEFINEVNTVGLVIVFSGHVHSFENHRYGRDNPLAFIKDGLVVGNVAAPNARRANRSLMTIMDIGRAENGRLKVVPVEQAVSVR